MDNQNLQTTQILIHQCNHWFSEYVKLKNSINYKNNYHLMIEALGCAKGNLCILKELDLKNKELYAKFLENIDTELNNIYKNQKVNLAICKYTSYKKGEHLIQSNILN